MIDLSVLQSEFNTLYPVCNDFAKELPRHITKIIDEASISLAFPIQYRTKTFESIVNKIGEGRFTPKKSVSEFQDLIGLRILLLFNRDTDIVANLIRDNFFIKREYHTLDKLQNDQFGYSSIHQVIELNEDWLRVPTFKAFKGIQVEIQIRTLSQHAWAEASNLFQYKEEASVPKELKRAIGRISALLETVDLEFERILSARESYLEEISKHNFSLPDDLQLNVDLIEQVLTRRLPIKNLTNDEDYSQLILDLKSKGINLIRDLEIVIDSSLQHALMDEKKICQEMTLNFNNINQLSSKNPVDISKVLYTSTDKIENIKNGVFFSHTGLIRQSIARYFSKSE